MEELRHELRGSDRFSALNFTNCDYQFEIEENARKLYAFITPWGIYRYKRMVMGTSPAGSEIQKRMHKTVRNCCNIVHTKMASLFMESVNSMTSAQLRFCVHCRRKELLCVQINVTWDSLKSNGLDMYS